MSNYPPEITGGESQITGEWPVDPHRPWSVTRLYGVTPDQWFVQYGNDEELMFSIGTEEDWAIPLNEAAMYVADKLNAITAHPQCCVNERLTCTICGEWWGSDMDEVYVLTPVRQEDGSYRLVWMLPS